MNTRLKQFISAENISQSQFADSIQVVRASVSHVLSGRNNPGYDFIKAIMKAYPNLNLEWLILGKGKMYKTESPVPSKEGDLFSAEADFFGEPDEIVSFNEASLDKKEEINSTAPQDDRHVERIQVPVTQRKVSKVIIFFDDGSYQEM